MNGRHLTRMGANSRGAVAPTVALSLFALIGAGGLAFDYAHMATLDTELQNAADQAALAAATQLDQKSDSIDRAIAAAQGLLSNETRLANDSGGLKVNVPDVVFYETKADAEAVNATDPTLCPTDNALDPADADSPGLARFVCVHTETRVANFALTPVVAAFSSGNLAAMAVAGIGHAICKTPPLMFCNPDEPIGNTNVDYPFDADGYAGRGMKLLGDGSYAPGNFGFLQTGYGNGANALLKALGYNTPPGDCLETDGVDTQTGVDASVMDGLNTRFDINAAGNSCPGGDVNCSPSVNVLKDVVRGNACGITGNGWEQPRSQNSDFTTVGGISYNNVSYRPTAESFYPSTLTPTVMGLPRDRCHAWSDAGNCTTGGGRIGNGNWDIDAYWRANHGAASGSGYPTSLNSEIATASGVPIPAGRTYPTRYQVYMWEIADYANRLRMGHGTVNGKSAYDRPAAGTCLATATSPYGIVPGGNNIDRRRISAAVLNCEALGLAGHEVNQPVIKWVDLFIVEPSINRSNCTQGAGCNTKYSDKKDFYVEIVGETASGSAGTTAGQVVKRDVPYLVK